MKNIAIFASGSGTNAENITYYFKDSTEVKIALILSNKKDAYVLERAKNMGIDSVVIEKPEFIAGEKVLEVMREYKIDFIVLAGFLLLVPKSLIAAYPHRIVNIHPALLPKHGGRGMYGDRVHEEVVAMHDTESGITIHFIDEHYDKGSVAFQATCPVLPTDTPHDVATKVHALEYAHYPHVIKEIVEQL